MRKLLIGTSGGFLHQGLILQRVLMLPFSKALSFLNLLRESGNPRLPLSVNFSCGLLPTTDAGLRTDWLRGGYLIQIIVAFVIKKWKIFSTFSWDVSSLETWFSLLSRFGFAALAPQPSDQSFDNWWRKVDGAVSGDYNLGLNSLVILGAWSIWRHRNDCVFNGASPNVNLALAMAREEAHWWSRAGAKGISLLTAGGSV
jgi:hypothetical protein